VEDLTKRVEALEAANLALETQVENMATVLIETATRVAEVQRDLVKVMAKTVGWGSLAAIVAAVIQQLLGAR
jgi:hypothetical protein